MTRCSEKLFHIFQAHVSGFRLAGVTVASLAYGWLILDELPYWQRMEAAEQGPELQTRLFPQSAEVAVALDSLAAQARPEAFTFYALDTVNAVLFGLSLAALMAFGLGLLRLGARAGWLIALPLVSAASDIIENAVLTLALAQSPQAPPAFSALIGPLTGIKLLTGYASIAVMLSLVIAGGLAWGWARGRAWGWRRSKGGPKKRSE